MRLPPEQHAAIAQAAARAGVSLNAWVAERLRV
ncbi:MAG: toxin-antitoxin system HicB family antitoxin [Gammaproteobacteria bacterium]|nr:toxin-antitoxin system HicB family antitoxin [Gammaproteobacteria bacterium]